MLTNDDMSTRLHVLGYILEGRVELKIGNRLHRARPGDVIYLTSELPSRWKNTGEGTARLLWVKNYENGDLS